MPVEGQERQFDNSPLRSGSLWRSAAFPAQLSGSRQAVIVAEEVVAPAGGICVGRDVRDPQGGHDRPYPSDRRQSRGDRPGASAFAAQAAPRHAVFRVGVPAMLGAVLVDFCLPAFGPSDGNRTLRRSQGSRRGRAQSGEGNGRHGMTIPGSGPASGSQGRLGHDGSTYPC